MKEEKKGVSVVTLIIVIMVCIALGVGVGYLFGNKNLDGDKSSGVEKNDKKTDSTKDSGKSKEKYEIKEVLYDTAKYGNASIETVELTTDGKVLVSIVENKKKIVDRREIEKGVNNSYLVHVGQSGICEGNARLIFDKGNNSFSYLNIDDLVCGHDVNKFSIEGLSDVTSIVEEGDTGNFEPDYYRVYAVDSNGGKTEITDKLLEE